MKHVFQKFYRFKESRRGQVSVLIGIMILTFILFFQFVISTGMLINAKINLQNAADMAAFSGASTLARQLNQVSYLNYEMRRVYKKFLFRYYVIGGVAQASFHAENEFRSWSPDNKPGHDFQVPTVCVIFNSEDNVCQVYATKAIKIPEGSPMDAVGSVLQGQLGELEKIRKEQCSVLSFLNRDTLIYWLYKTTDNADALQALLEQAQTAITTGSTPNSAAKLDNLKKNFQSVKALTQGLGLVPKEILLHERIKTLQRYINFEPQVKLNTEKITQLSISGDTASHERPINAFMSAYETLGDHTFPGSDIEVDELLPRGLEGAALANFKPINASFETYYLDFPGLDTANANNNQDCIGVPNYIPVKDVPLGVYKDTDYLTYYAVRVRAKARILFNPFGPVELKAYAAARPFGSRIGPSFPDLSEEEKHFQFVQSQKVAYFPEKGPTLFYCDGQCSGVPNLPIIEGDTTKEGWNRVSWIKHLESFMQEDGATKTYSNLEPAYEAAMVPTLWEKGQYNIPNDLGEMPETDTKGDPFIRYFDDNLIYAFWAPIFPPDFSDEELVNRVSELFSQKVQGTAKNVMVESFIEYLSDLRQGRGERGEGFNIARIFDPIRRFPIGSAGGIPEPIPVSSEFILNSKEGLKTSWNTDKDGDFNSKGRVGYSVKFVSFKSLLSQGGGLQASGQGDAYNNVNFLDGEAEREIGSQGQHIDH